MGQIQGNQIAADAKFEAAQIQAMTFIVAARGNEQESAMLTEYAQQAEANMAASAVSGIGNASFASIAEGNTADMNKNIGKARDAQGDESRRLMAERELVKIEGKYGAKAARLKGFMGAVSAIKGGEDMYQEYGQGSRTSSFMRSVGFKE